MCPVWNLSVTLFVVLALLQVLAPPLAPAPTQKPSSTSKAKPMFVRDYAQCGRVFAFCFPDVFPLWGPFHLSWESDLMTLDLRPNTYRRVLTTRWCVGAKHLATPLRLEFIHLSHTSSKRCLSTWLPLAEDGQNV